MAGFQIEHTHPPCPGCHEVTRLLGEPNAPSIADDPATVERVARAICDWQETGKYDALATKSPYDSAGLHQEHWRIMARAALAAMREGGFDAVSKHN